MSKKRINQIQMGGVTAVLLFTVVLYILLPINAVRWANNTPSVGFFLDPNLILTNAGKSEQLRVEHPNVSHPYRLTALDGAAVQSNQSFFDRLATYEIGDDVELTFDTSLAEDSSESNTETIIVTLSKFERGQLITQFWVLYAVGIIFLIIGSWTFLTKPQSLTTQIFATFCALGALATGLIFDGMTTQLLLRVWVVALSFSASLNVVLILIFPHNSRLINRFPRLKWLVLLPAAVICVWGQLWLYDNAVPLNYVVPWRAAYMLNGIALLVSLGVMAYRGTQSPSPFVRQQGRLVLAGAAIGFAPVMFFFFIGSVNLASSFSWLVPQLYLPFIVIYPLTFGYLIIRHQLMDMELVIRRGIAYGVILLLLFGGLALIVTGLGNVVDTTSPMVLALLIVIVLVAFAPLRDGLQRELDRLVFHRPAQLNDYLRDYSRELKTAVSAGEVQEILLRYAQIGVPNTNPQLFLSDSETNSFTNGNGLAFEAGSKVVKAMRAQATAIDLAEERAWPKLLRAEKEDVSRMDAAVIVPMNAERELIGWLTIGAKPQQQNYAQGELTYLEDLADQSLVGLERAKVIERLEARVAELDIINQFAQLLNFMITLDDMLELIYTNFRVHFEVKDFYITLFDVVTEELYTVFYVADGKRQEEKEGRKCIVVDDRIQEVVDSGQMNIGLEDGRYHIIAPLNAGALTIGTIHTFYQDRTLPRHQVELFEIFADRAAVALDRLQSQQVLTARAQQLESFNQITLSLTSIRELDSLLEMILDKAIELLNTEAGTFMLVDEPTGQLEFRVVRGPASDELMGTRLPIGAGIAGTVAQTGRPLITNRAQEDKRRFTEVDDSTEYTTQSMLTVPLMLQNAVVGVLQVINKRDELEFNTADQQLLVGFAGQAVVALDNTRLLTQTDEALQNRVTELSMLQQLDRDLNTTLDLDQVVGLTLDRTLQICSGTAGSVVLLDELDGRLEVHASRGYTNIDPQRLHIGIARNTISAHVVENGQRHVTGNVHEDPHYLAASPATQSQLTLPIIHQRKTIGAIAIESDELDAFSEVMVETAVRVINHAGVAIANALLYAQVTEANVAKSEFVSIVSHELKTPMTAIRGYTDLLLSGIMGDLTEKQQNFLDIISHNIQRMGTQVQDLTDISRIESGRLHMETMPIEFAQIVSETLPSVQAQCDEKNITINLDMPPVGLPTIRADRSRLVQVLTNLLSNACKYSPSDRDIFVSFCTKEMVIVPEEPARKMVVCSVKDNGYGISEADQHKMFTKFFRSEDTNIRQAKGTGLGLSITKGIVELHDGRIWLESTLGEGSTFHFAIPQAQE